MTWDTLWGVSGLSAALAWFGLPYHSPFGYELWITVFGFILGTYAGHIPARMTFVRSGGILVASITAMLILNRLFNVNFLNYYFILVSSVMVCNILLVRRLPYALGPFILPFAGCVLEIYLLHCYLFVRSPASAIAGFALSLTLILLTAMTLSKINSFLAAARSKPSPA